MNRIVISVLVAGSTAVGFGPALAQHARLIKGVVRSAADSMALEGVTVRLLDSSMVRVTTTSAKGAFLLQTPDGPVCLIAVRIGFRPDTLDVAPRQNDLSLWLLPAPAQLSPVEVSAEPAYSAASSRTIRELDLHLRPRLSSQELLRLVPGLVIAQHAGGGKAEQIFLRGFDADHGTDVAIDVDGVPVNMISHAHGQGYADLHWLLPEIVSDVAVRKGPYAAEDGDLATAGAVSVRTKDRLTQGEVSTRGGSFTTGHTLALVPLGRQGAPAGGYLAVAAHYTNGPFVNPQHYRRDNLFGKWTMPIGSSTELIATASGYDAPLNAARQIPGPAV